MISEIEDIKSKYNIAKEFCNDEKYLTQQYNQMLLNLKNTYMEKKEIEINNIQELDNVDFQTLEDDILKARYNFIEKLDNQYIINFIIDKQISNKLFKQNKISRRDISNILNKETKFKKVKKYIQILLNYLNIALQEIKYYQTQLLDLKSVLDDNNIKLLLSIYKKYVKRSILNDLNYDELESMYKYILITIEDGTDLIKLIDIYVSEYNLYDYVEYKHKQYIKNIKHYNEIIDCVNMLIIT